MNLGMGTISSSAKLIEYILYLLHMHLLDCFFDFEYEFNGAILNDRTNWVNWPESVNSIQVIKIASFIISKWSSGHTKCDLGDKLVEYVIKKKWIFSLIENNSCFYALINTNAQTHCKLHSKFINSSGKLICILNDYDASLWVQCKT